MAQDDTTSSDPGFFDNEVLDQFEVPFGEWMDQAVDWIDTNLEWLLEIIEWPFDFLLTNFVDDFLTADWMSWVYVCLAFFVLGSLARNVKVGVFSALALAGCGILGNAYWLQTARTIGFIFVAVLLCVIIGIPIGVLCGRIDPVWRVVRPILDAMQVVHSFVYMLPFIFFFGIGSVSATMVTMVFALPPLIRLTNLGIRQVPEDVVEASRAYGAREMRVLMDVQLPLARPAIMTGVNQTLLLAISMLGIAAIMGAGGLGQLLFNALSNQDVAKATSAGLAFFLVAVVLDRISQREDSDSGNLYHRIKLAWAHRRDPEALIPVDGPAEETTQSSAPRFAEVESAEQTPMIVTGVGALVAAVSVFLTWNSDAGMYSAYGRRSDEELPGDSFNGLSASGGSWFGIMLLVFALFVLGSVIIARRAPGKGPRWMTTDGAVIASITMFVMMLAYVLGNSAPRVEVSTGIGVWIALIGSAVAAAGSLMWIRTAPHSPLHPLSADIAWGRVVGISIAFLVLFTGAVSGWSFDSRSDVVLSPEIEQRIEELQQEARDRPEDAGPIGAEISATLATATSDSTIITSGVSSDGTRFGIWTMVLGALAFVTTLGAAGAFGIAQHRQWEWGTVTAGLGGGIVAITVGWVAVQVRSADPNYVSGIGSFLAMCGGFFVVGAVVSILNEFRRTKIYDDDPGPLELIDEGVNVDHVEELVGVDLNN